MRKISIITLGLLAILFFVGLFFYARYGGFNDPEIKTITVPEYKIIGKEYTGKMTAKEFGQLFEAAEKMLKEGKVKGDVAGVFYTNPQKESDTVQAFVGVLLKDSLQVLPEGYTIRTVAERKVIQAHIKAHVLVSPFVYPDIEEFAKENNIVLTHVPAVEIYPSTEEMFIQVPVIE